MHHSSHNWQISKKIGGINIVLDYLTYQNLELPWRPKTGKEYTKTAKEIVLGGQPPSNMRQE